MKKKDCANPQCGKEFVPKAHNAIYCGPECRTIIMNQPILARYHERKKRLKNNEKRTCSKKNCNNVLSRYNKEPICETCKTERLIKRLGRWGWNEEKLRDEWSE
jgi:hypothetical protein